MCAVPYGNEVGVELGEKQGPDDCGSNNRTLDIIWPLVQAVGAAPPSPSDEMPVKLRVPCILARGRSTTKATHDEPLQ
jgi:hypothetical protein